MTDSTDSAPLQLSNVWSKTHVYTEPLVEKIRMRVGYVEADFAVSVCFNQSQEQLIVSVKTEEPVDYTFNYWFFFPKTDKPEWPNNEMTQADSTSWSLTWNMNDNPANHPLVLELDFKDMKYRQMYPLPNDGLKSYIERGPSVLLVGHDGSVSVPMRALKIWSETFEAMFKLDWKEKKTGRIELKDYDYKTLNAFSHFLLTGWIKDGKDTALGLILLADKYNIRDLKEAAENFVKKNFDDMNQEEVLDECELFYSWLINHQLFLNLF